MKRLNCSGYIYITYLSYSHLSAGFLNHKVQGCCWIPRSQLVLVNAVNANQLCLENESRTAGDRANATVTVAVLRWDGECALLTDTHIQKTLVPSDEAER